MGPKSVYVITCRLNFSSVGASKKQQGIRVPVTVIMVGKVLSKISTHLTVLYLARLFTTPIRHKLPKREIGMNAKSRHTKINIDATGHEIMVYEYGESARKVLLVHGWSGRGTQLVKIADRLLAAGYSTVSFDAPAHGKSSGNRTLMPDFIACIKVINNIYGPFDAAVGHSLGGMSLLNAVNEGFTVRKLVAIGSGDIVSDIMDEFIAKMKLPKKYSTMMCSHFERKSARTMESYSAYLAAAGIKIPVLVIHDSNDTEVPLKCAENIHQHLEHGQLKVTNHLGHRKILGNDEVINTLIQFLQYDLSEKDLRADHTADRIIV